MELRIMTNIRTLIAVLSVTDLAGLALAPSAPAPMVTPADAKNHIGETVTVCGKVVDSRKIPRYGIAGHGKPISFDLDQPEASSVFYFVAFGAQPGGPDEVIAAYKDKRVCVTGKIAGSGSGAPFILAADRTQIKVQTDNK